MKSLLVYLAAVAAVLPVHGDEVFQKRPAKPVDLARDKNLYVVGYAHLDTEWRWAYPETIQDYIRNTLEQNFALLEKYPNYVFNFTGSRRYEFMKEYYPAEYARVKQYVAQGRWVPAGSSVDENDANVPSLESITRHFLYGNHFFQREFGTQSEDYTLPDCFGFPASLPAIMAHGGLKGFSTQKLTWGSAVGIPFNFGVWIGPDGSSVLAAMNPGAYSSQVNEDLSKSEMWLNRINEDGARSGVYADYKYFGIGDRGGACKPATAEWIERAVANDNGPVRVTEGRADQLFKDITPAQRASLPSYQGELELVNHSDGSLSSQAYMKRWNRQNEQLAQAAEGAATTAAWLGVLPYPSDALYGAWDLVLGSQMHDILPGTSAPKAYEYAWNDEVLALNQFAHVEEGAVAGVLAALDTRAEGVPVAVYNPLATDREDPVEATVTFPGAAPESIAVDDPQGRPVPAQILGRQGATLRVVFLAHVPSLGYAVYALHAGAGVKSTLAVTAESLENARYRVRLNAGGDIASVFDKSLNRELLSAPARLSFHTENSFVYPAWNMEWSDRQLPTRGYVGGPARIRILEDGPARVALEVARDAEGSTFVQQIRLAAGGAADRLEVVNKIDWRTQVASLRADFPLAAANPEASFDDKVGVVRRGNNDEKHFELSQQQWMDLTDKDGSFGVSILNDSKFGSDKPDDHMLRLTMLFTPGVRERFTDQATQDVGRHDIAFALTGHRGSWAEGGTAWQAARLNQPLRAFLPAAHPGPLGREFSFASLNNDQVQIAALKKAEDSDEIIVRLRELTGLPASGLALRFATPISAAREVDGQERPIGRAVIKDGALTFDMKKFGLRAFALRVSPAVNAGVARVDSQPVALPYDTDVVSSRAQRSDGAMDGAGAAYPAELFPAHLEQAGVVFHLGPAADGAKNALTAHGQQIALPAGGFNRVHLLAAADGDASGRIRIGTTDQPCDVPNWTGYVGSWDNRIWDPADPTVEHKGAPIGLTPGFIKRTPVAWYATHHNTPQGDAFYEYSYLFELSYDLPAGTQSLTLPDNPKIRVFAVSVGHEPGAAPAAAPLYDTLADHQVGGLPAIPQAGETYQDATRITLLPPLYFQPHDLHYTLDGSEPTAASPVYAGPFFASETVHLAVRQIAADGRASAVVRGSVQIKDTTPPRVTSVLTGKGNTLKLKFSEPLNRALAADVVNYTFEPAIAVSKIDPSTDGAAVNVTFGVPLVAGTAYTVALHGITDASPAANALAPVKEPFNADNIVYTLRSAELPGGAVTAPVLGLPALARDHWTMNLFVKTDAKPADRLILAGFGKPENGNGVSARYIALYPQDIEFWLGASDLKTNSPLDLGRWQMVTATYNGDTLALYKDGEPIGKTRVGLTADADASVSVGGPDPWTKTNRFTGSIHDFTIRRGALSEDEVKKLFEQTKPAP